MKSKLQEELRLFDHYSYQILYYDADDSGKPSSLLTPKQVFKQRKTIFELSDYIQFDQPLESLQERRAFVKEKLSHYAKQLKLEQNWSHVYVVEYRESPELLYEDGEVTPSSLTKEETPFRLWLDLQIHQEKSGIQAYQQMDRRRCKAALDRATARLEAYEKTKAIYELLEHF